MTAAPVRAIHFADREALREAALPGSVHFTEPPDQVVGHLWFFCPCGCGRLGIVPVGVNFKPIIGDASWKWNGQTETATLEPSLRQLVCGWHGWLRDGYWESC